MTDRPFFVQADCISASAPVEAYSIETQKERFITSASSMDEVKQTLLDIPAWLPIAAEAYNISPNIKDYVLQPVTSILSDIPNRNGHSFSARTLSSWTPDRYSPMYKTFAGVPMHLEHNNKDPSIAKGIVLSSVLKPVENSSGELWRVVNLMAIDRNRDSVLANAHLTGKRKCFSMGAYTRDYKTVCCGAKATKGGCEHLQSPMKPSVLEVNGRLAYWSCIDPSGFEISSVAVPAYAYAESDHIMSM